MGSQCWVQGSLGAAPGGSLELAVADITKPDSLKADLFQGVRAVICCTAVNVSPKEGDTPNRDKYKQVSISLPWCRNGNSADGLYGKSGNWVCMAEYTCISLLVWRCKQLMSFLASLLAMYKAQQILDLVGFSSNIMTRDA